MVQEAMGLSQEQIDLNVMQAMNTVDRLVQALNAGDEAAADRCFTARSAAAPFRPPANRGKVVIEVDEIETTDESVIAAVTLTCSTAHPPSVSLPFVLVREGGEWKIDMPATMQRKMSPGRGAAIRAAASALPAAAGEISGLFDVAGEPDEESEPEDEEDSSEDDEAEELEQEEEPEDDEPQTEADRERELLEAALPGMKSMIPNWEQMIATVAGHPVRLEIDFDSLGGRHSLLMSLIHGTAAVIEAFMHGCFDPSIGPKLKRIGLIRTKASPARDSDFSTDGVSISVTIPVDQHGNHPSKETYANELRGHFG